MRVFVKFSGYFTLSSDKLDRKMNIGKYFLEIHLNIFYLPAALE